MASEGWTDKEEAAAIAITIIAGGGGSVGVMYGALFNHLVLMQISGWALVAGCVFGFGFIYWKNPLP